MHITPLILPALTQELTAAGVDPMFLLSINNEPLDFVQGGIAVRALLPVLGKPFSNYNHDMGGRRLKNRTVTFNLSTKDKLVGSTVSTELYVKAIVTLAKVGINSFNITSGGWLNLHIPYDAFVSSYYKSDDPAVWKEKNDVLSARAEAKLRVKEAVREAKRAAAEADWQVRLAEKRQKEAQEAQAASNKQEARERVSKLRQLDESIDVHPTRKIKLEEEQ